MIWSHMYSIAGPYFPEDITWLDYFIYKVFLNEIYLISPDKDT